MMEFITNLMMSDSFIPHGHCYLWNTQLVGLHLVSDLTIAIAYFSIPLTLFYFVEQREDLPFNWIFTLFGAFIIFCGTTHLLEVWTLWHPVYWLSGAVKAITAIVSAFTAIVLVRLMPQALKLPSQAQLEAANRELQQQIRDRELAEAQIQQLNEELEARVAARTQELAASMLQAGELAERLSLAIEAAGLGICDWNIITKKITWNRYHEILLDYQPGTLAEYTYEDWERRVHPDDLTRVLAAIDLAMATQTDYSAEYRVIWADGSIHWLDGFGRFYYNSEGLPIRMTGLAKNITERKHTELALVASEERLNLTIDAARIGTFDWNILTHQVTWNDYHRLLLGYGVEIPASNAAWERRVHPEDLARVRTTIQLARDTHTDYACEYRIIWEDGSSHWLEAFGKFYYDRDARPIRMTGIVDDITDRKQAELELQQSERRYRALIEATAQITWSTAANGHIVVEQPTWSDFTGQSFEEYRRWGWSAAFHPDDRARIDELWLISLNNLTTFEMEQRLRRYDGEYRDMSVRAVPILEADGSVQEWVGVHTDITDRKRDELNLRRSEEFNRRILENNKDCIKVLDLEGRLLYMNDGGKKLLEIGDFAEYHRALWMEFWGGTDRESANLAWQAAKAGKTSKFEGQCPTVMGVPKWWQVTVAPMFDDRGNVEQILSISHDITDRIQSELAIRESEEQFRSTFEQAAVGVAHVDLDGRWLLVNQRFCEIVGYSETELLGNNFQDISFPDDIPADLECIRQILAGEIQIIKLEKRYLHKSGRLVWIGLTASLRRSDAGEPMYFIASFEDISARKQSEFDLQAQAVKLAQTTALVEQRNQELDRFTHIVSHDLKAPLRGIANLSEWIADDLSDEVDPDIQKNLELMRSRVYRMEALISGLLEYARVGNTQESLVAFSVAQLLDEIVDSLNLPDGFTIELPGELPPITTNRILLSQVLANLIGNAYKHHDRAEGRIRVTAQARSDDLWEFTVTDDGPGIAPANQERVFGIFQTLATANKDNTGIGLSIVKKIVETQGGNISIECPIDRGTTFRFTWRTAATE
jgi:PAS domain S-box-containing protein